MKRVHIVVGALSMAVLGIAADAAAVSTRAIVPGAAFVPRYEGSLPGQSDRDKFSYPQPAFVRVSGLGFDSDFAYGNMTIPVDSTFVAPSGLTFKLRVFGGNSNQSQMCLAAYTVSATGVISAFAGSHCSAGAAAIDQTLSRTLNVSSDTAVLLSIAGQNNSIAKHLQVAY